MASRRERQQRRLEGWKEKQQAPSPVVVQPEHHSKHRPKGFLHGIYHDHYKLLLIISFVILALAIIQIGVQTVTTGDFLNKGVSLKGGLTLTIPVNGEQVTPDQVQSLLSKKYPQNDILVQGVSELGTLKAITIQVASDSTDKTTVQDLQSSIIASVATLIPEAPQQYSAEVVGPSLGAAFFQQTFKAVIIAFLLMGMVLFFYFGQGGWWIKTIVAVLSVAASFLIFQAAGIGAVAAAIVLGLGLAWLFSRYSPPSGMVILCAFSDIVGTLAVVNLLGIKVSTAGVAAFLMLIGYSVDTDILLSTRVLKHKHGTVYERVISSLKTGVTMSISSAAAALIGLLVSQAPTIREIMLIIFIGLTLDIIFTWIQNVGLLRWYIEKRMATTEDLG